MAHRKVVESGSVGHRRQDVAPGNGDAAGRDYLAYSCKCVPALCAGFVVSLKEHQDRQKVVIPYCKGKAWLVRFADDFVCIFEKEEDAKRFFDVLGKRLGKFGLELSAEKTQIIPFSPNITPGKTAFDFLGFEFRWEKDRKGKPHVKRRTARKSLRNSRKRFAQWCRTNRHRRLPDLFKAINAKLRGYYTCTHRRCGVTTSGFMATLSASMRSISMPSER